LAAGVDLGVHPGAHLLQPELLDPGPLDELVLRDRVAVDGRRGREVGAIPRRDPDADEDQEGQHDHDGEREVRVERAPVRIAR
jgi:hypothetical protein